MTIAIMSLKVGLLLSLYLITVQSTAIKDQARPYTSSEVRNMYDKDLMKLLRTTKQTENIRVTSEVGRHRTRRSTFHQSGVKICPQETIKEVVASHRAYYKLRVCQEAVWEAFRVFLDRLPSNEDYQRWVFACQHESLCLDDLARNFSHSQEHIDMVQKRVVSAANKQQEREAVSSDPGPSGAPNPDIAGPGDPATAWPFPDPAPSDIIDGAQGTDLPNAVSEMLVEQVVEFSITVADPGYSDWLSGPDMAQYHDFARSLHNQMTLVFEKLPGFKELRVLGCRSGGETVCYAVVFETDAAGCGDYMDEIMHMAHGEARSADAEFVSAGPSLKEMVAKALSDQTSLPVDLQSLSFDNVSQPTVPTAAEIAEELNTASPEPDSHNELTVVTPQPADDVEKPLVRVSVAPVLRENDLETLLDPTAIPEEERVKEVSVSVVDSKAITSAAPPLEGEVTDPPSAAPPATPPPPASPADDPPPANSEPEPQPEEGVAGPAEDELLPGDPEGAEAEGEIIDQHEPADAIEVGGVPEVTPEPDSGTAEIPSNTETDYSEDGVGEVDSEPLDGNPTLPGVTVTPSADLEPPEAPLTESPTVASARVLTTVAVTLADFKMDPVEEAFTTEAMVTVTEEHVAPDLEDPPASLGSPWGAEGDEGAESSEDMVGDLAGETMESNGMQNYGNGYPAETGDRPFESTPPPPLRYLTTPSMTTASKGKELVVFFSLRVTNINFSDDLFNKSSPEYQSLENTFLELILPYLQSNLTGFKELEILNFRNGSVVVNSKMRFAKSVPYNITEAVQCVLEDFCNAESQRLDIEIDSHSLDIEPADRADPCKFLACNEFSQCVVNRWTRAAECVCDPGYGTRDGLPCQSVCSLRPDYCLNGGQCEIVPGHGATCRCLVGKYWHFHGDRCSELASLSVDPMLLVAGVVGSLILLFAIIGILVCIKKKCVGTREAVTLISPGKSARLDQTS